VLQRVANAEAALRSGEFQSSLQYSSGTRSLSSIIFDLGDASHPPRLHLATSYQSGNQIQTIERIAIGERGWQRKADGTWTEIAETEGAWGQIQAFLPHAASASNAEIVQPGSPTILHWYDPNRSTDITLKVDPITGTPQELRQLMRTTNSILVVGFNGWNTPVEIAPPF
jgi:hypothetical protein